MAKLIACRACDNQISKDARACPKCGAPSKRTGIGRKIGAGVLGLFIFLVVMGAIAGKRAPGTSAAKTSELPVSVSAQKLAADYNANEVSADELYRDKMLRVSGVVDSIKKDITDDPYVVLRTDNRFMGVHANFEDTAGLSALSAGQKITVRCIGNNVIMGSPILKDCVLE